MLILKEINVFFYNCFKFVLSYGYFLDDCSLRWLLNSNKSMANGYFAIFKQARINGYFASFKQANIKLMNICLLCNQDIRI